MADALTSLAQVHSSFQQKELLGLAWTCSAEHYVNCTWKTDNKTNQAGWSNATMERKRLHLKDIKAENQEKIKQQEGEGLYKKQRWSQGTEEDMSKSRVSVAIREVS